MSTLRQVIEGESLDVQRRQIEGYAHMHGITVDHWVVEQGVSGSVPVSQRPAGAEMFRSLRAGDLVIAAKLDRLFRSALDALHVVEDTAKRGVRLHLLDLGGDIQGNGMSRLFLTITAAFAEAERDRIRERISNVKADQKARARYLGGKVPFGFAVSSDGGLEKDAGQQAAIARIIAMRLNGNSLRHIASMIRQDGISISHAAIANVLQRSRHT